MTMNESKTMLKDMPWEEAQEIYKAYHNKESVDFYTPDGWKLLKTPISVALWSDFIYRIPPPVEVIPDSIDWTQIDDRFIFMARDKNESCWVYTERPDQGPRGWSVAGTWLRIDNVLTSYKRGNIDWKDSLVWRPGHEPK